MKAHAIYEWASRIGVLEAENAKLRAALEAAQEALFWHDGMAFEYNGQIVGQQIANALAKPASNSPVDA